MTSELKPLTLFPRPIQPFWWRRPQPFQLHAEITNPAYRAFALAVDAFWVNHPLRDQAAAHKVDQLKVALEEGSPRSGQSAAHAHGPAYRAAAAQRRGTALRQSAHRCEGKDDASRRQEGCPGWRE
jgi:hypothetical protein